MTRDNSFTQQQRDLISELTRIAKENGFSLWIVGGLTRDLLLGQPFKDKDIDFIVEGNALEFAARVKSRIGGRLQEFRNFLTAKILCPSAFPEINEVDFATARTETYLKPGSLPNVSPASINEDLQRRDFTINALAINTADLLTLTNGAPVDLQSRLWGKIVSVVGSREDIESRTIRVLHDKSFIDDPTRIFRAARYKARLDGRFSTSTEKLIRDAICQGALESISDFRKLTEIKKILKESDFIKIFVVLNSLETFKFFKLFDFGHFCSVKEALFRLQELATKERLEEKLIVELALRIFYYYSDSWTRKETFLSFGVSKKKIALWSEDKALAASKPESGREGAMFQALIK